MVKIEFELRGPADDLQRLQARGIIALLIETFGKTVLEGIGGTTTIVNNTVVQAAPGAPVATTAARDFSAPSAGGQASMTGDDEPELDPALVFGGTQTPSTNAPPVDDEPEQYGGDATLDSRGFPWDERIHAATKALNADKSWRYKRNVDKDLIPTVETELKGLQALAAPIVPKPPVVPAPPTVTAAPTPPAPPITPAAPPAAPAAPTAEGEFIRLMRKITAAQGANKVTKDATLSMLSDAGIQGLMAMKNGTPEQLAMFEALFDAQVG